MKPTPTSSNGQTELYKWNCAAGEEMQLDILFAPSFSKDKNPGPRMATMKFSGPGPAGAGHGPRQWMQILDGQARFGCQLSRYLNHDPDKIPETLCGPNYECTKIKWAPMQ